MNWNPQIHRILEEAKLRARNITEFEALPWQKLAWIQTYLKPYLTYLSKQDLYRLDAVLAQTAKSLDDRLGYPCQHPHALCSNSKHCLELGGVSAD